MSQYWSKRLTKSNKKKIQKNNHVYCQCKYNFVEVVACPHAHIRQTGPRQTASTSPPVLVVTLHKKRQFWEKDLLRLPLAHSSHSPPRSHPPLSSSLSLAPSHSPSPNLIPLTHPPSGVGRPHVTIDAGLQRGIPPFGSSRHLKSPSRPSPGSHRSPQNFSRQGQWIFMQLLRGRLR